MFAVVAAVSAAVLLDDTDTEPRPVARPARPLVPGTWQTLPGPGDDLLLAERSAVWAGDELVVWGYTRAAQADLGAGRRSEARLYHPERGTWRTAAPTPLRLIRFGATLLWTGSEVVVLGGSDPNVDTEPPRDVAAYNPRTDSWRTLPELPIRHARGAVWTGSTIVVVGGAWGTLDADLLVALDPDEQDWTAPATLPAAIAPEATDVGMAWDGSQVVIRWGGTESDPASERTLRFDPRSSTFEDLGISVEWIADLVGRRGSVVSVASGFANDRAFLRAAVLEDSDERWIVGPSTVIDVPCVPRGTAVGRRVVVWCPSGAPPWVFESGGWKVLPAPPEATFGPLAWSGEALYGIAASGNLLEYRPAR